MYSSCSPINAYQIQQRNFKDEIFADDKLTAKTAKITSLENLYVYSICLFTCYGAISNLQIAIQITCPILGLDAIICKRAIHEDTSFSTSPAGLFQWCNLIDS